jgi:hypothetical protein
MIGLGVGSLTLALIEYERQLRGLKIAYSMYGPYDRSLTAALAAAVSGLGIFGFVLVFLRQ